MSWNNGEENYSREYISPLLPLIISCWLGAVILSPCDSESADVARAYSAVSYAIPAEHLVLIRGLYWVSGGNRGESWYQTGRVGLQRKPSLHVLAHEVGHLVSFRGGLIDRYRSRFWPGGVQVDGTPSKYGRANVYEDFAETYSRVIEGDTAAMPGRAAWLRGELPALRSH